MWMASSQAATCLAPASASEYTATVLTARRRAVAATRQAISPRLAIRIFVNMGWSSLHPEHAELHIRDRRIQRGRQAQRQHAARVGRVDDAVVPQSGGGGI